MMKMGMSVAAALLVTHSAFAEKPKAFGDEYERHWSRELNAEIDANIEKYRKADCTVAVEAADGTEVKVEQIDHDFRFGCNIFNFDQLGDDGQNAEYRAAFMKGGLFNAATVPFYWKDLEPECGRPLHVSEITIPSPRGCGGLSDEEADRIQARLVRDNFRLWFSWPSVYRISYWNLVDGIGGEILPSGFYNRDMTKKPAYHALHDLIWKEWMTKTTATVADGRISFRGFRGRYRLTWKDAAGHEVSSETEVE